MLAALGSGFTLIGSRALVAVVTDALGLRRAISYARAAAVACLACVALTGLEQTRVLRAGVGSLASGIALLLAVLVTGVGAWFWARWPLNLA